jgi:hypothetical protein
MHRSRWRPPLGSAYGVCPACEQWTPLTEKGYVKEHRIIVRDGRPVALHTRGAVVTTGEKIIRCVGVGRDPRKHECQTPQPSERTGSRWSCRCGLTWVTVRADDTVQWRLL